MKTNLLDIAKALEIAQESGTDVVIPNEYVRELNAIVCEIIAKIRYKVLEKFYKKLRKICGESFWVTLSPQYECVRLKLLCEYKNDNVRKVYKYINKYYQYTDIELRENGNLMLYLLCKGVPIYVSFDVSDSFSVPVNYRDKVKAWALDYEVGEYIKSDSDIITWVTISSIVGDNAPFMRCSAN